MSEENKKIRVNPSFVLNCLVVVAILYNSWVHSTSDAFLYYKDNISRLEKEINNWQDSLIRDFVSQIVTLTNVLSVCSTNTLVSPFPESSSVLKYSDSFTSVTNVPLVKFDRVCSVGSNYYAYVGNWRYAVGDNICGYEILDISPVCVNLGGRLIPVQDRVNSLNINIPTFKRLEMPQ